jgi:hypothetical protein
MDMRTGIVTLALLTAGPAFLQSCNYSHALSPQEAAQTSAVETLSARLTGASLATPTVPPTDTPVPPTATIMLAPSPWPTATVACEDGSEFVADITVPDNTVMKPGQSFGKTWRLRNTGTCDWTTAFEAARVGGASMGGPAAVPLAEAVAPGGTGDISIELTAPTTNGVHRSNYQVRNADDSLFGIVFYVQVLVGPTPAPTEVVYRSGKLTIDNGSSVDFDSGSSAGNPQGDVRVLFVSDSERYLEPTNGALLKEMSGMPSDDECRGSSLGSDTVNFAEFSTGSQFCYKTSGGRYGRFEVEKIEADSVGFDFRTWN